MYSVAYNFAEVNFTVIRIGILGLVRAKTARNFKFVGFNKLSQSIMHAVEH